MRYEFFVALRFLRQGGAQTALIFGGAAFGVGVIVFLTALLDGLQKNLIDRTLGSQAHVVVRAPDLTTQRPLRLGAGERGAAIVERPAQRLQGVDEWPKVMRAVEAIDGVVATSPVTNGPGFIRRGQAEKSINVFGVLPERFDRIVPITPKLVAGRFRLEGGEVVIGQVLADDLGVGLGDKVRIVGTDGVSEVFAVAGVFDLGNRQVNQRWALVSLRAAQALLQLPGGITNLDVRVDQIFEAQRLADQIERRTGLKADSWMVLNNDLLVGLKGQSSSGTMISVFVVIAVALGIASVLIVSVVQKQREIGIMRATGTTAQLIQRIFLIQGAFVGAFASVLGSLLGAGLAKLFEGLAQNPNGSPTFPVALSPGLFVIASLVAVLVGLASAWGPARRAARLDPAQAIRSV